MEFHERIVAAVERCVPVTKVMSCDEFACRLIGSECEPGRAVEIAKAVKHAIRGVGETLRCSVGLGPNRPIAKMSADMQKPDGLTLPRFVPSDLNIVLTRLCGPPELEDF